MNDTQPLPTLVKGYEPTSVFSYPQQQPGINADLVAEFTDYLDTTKATAKTYAKSLKVFFNWITENHITNPQRQDLIAFRSQLLEKDKATTTANYINALKQFFKWLDFEGIYPDITNHLKGAKVGHEHRKDPLTEEQARELLASIDISNIEGLRDYAIIYLCLSCGLRTIEVARSNIEDLHTIADFVALNIQGKGKLDKSDFVKVPYQVEKAIRAYLSKRNEKDPHAPLFASNSDRNNGGRLTTNSVSRIVKTTMRKCGLDSERLTAHSLRHTCATLNLLHGGSLEETQQLLRHTNINTTMIYNHAIDRAKNQSEQRVANLLGK